MARDSKLHLDEVGYWSEIKLDIIRKYASAYSQILTTREKPKLYHVYIDGFAGAGKHISRTTGEFIDGSPTIALSVNPPFREYYFVDLNETRTEALRCQAAGRPNIYICNGDCNRVLLSEVFPKVQWENYKRGLCLLDPYGLHLDWEVMKTAGQMGTIDMFLNFPVADMNRNVFWRNPENVDSRDIERMNSFWGDESWRDVAYSTHKNLFGYPEKEDNETIAEGFRQRLMTKGGFQHVANPLPMRNTTGAIVYYLFFASQKPVAKKIIQDIFAQYRNRGTK